LYDAVAFDLRHAVVDTDANVLSGCGGNCEEKNEEKAYHFTAPYVVTCVVNISDTDDP